jgi:GT2 family glycosyltransferase
MRLAIIITTHNRRELLKKLLNQLVEQISGDDKIVVIDDGSADGTKEMLSYGFPMVSVVDGTGNWWYTKSVNEGFKFASRFNPEFFLTLNDDVEIYPDYLEKIIKAATMAGENCIINSLAINKDKPPKITFAGVKKYIPWNGRYIRYMQPFTEVNLNNVSGLFSTEIISGRGLLIPSQLIEELDYFDERFPQYGSDDDFGLRAIKKGYKLFVCYDARIIENTKTTSAVIAYNKASLPSFIKSFFNKYSINSIKKTILYSWRHGSKLLLPATLIIFLSGTFYAHFIKYKKVK